MRTQALAALMVAAACGRPSLSVVDEPAAEARPGGSSGPSSSLALHVAEARVRLVSVKDGKVEVPAEISGVTGTITVDGSPPHWNTAGALTLDLASWDSGLPVRDERVKTHFFGVPANPTATYSLDALDGLPAEELIVGEPHSLTARGTVYLAGGSSSLAVPVVLTRTADEAYLLTTRDPFTVSIRGLGLSGPLQALMRVCQHDSIADSVQVSAHVRLSAAPVSGARSAGAASPASPPPTAPSDAQEADGPRRSRAGAASPEMRRRLESFRGKRKLGKSKGKRKTKSRGTRPD